MSSVLRNVLKNTFAQAGAKVGSVLASIVLTVILTRALGKADFGVYTFIVSLTLLFGTIADWGTNIITVREASRDPKGSGSLFANAVVARLLLSLIAVFLLNLVVKIVPGWNEFSGPTAVASLVLLVLSFKTSAAMVFHSFQKLERSSLIDFLASGLFVFLVYLSLRLGSSLEMVFWMWFLATLLSALLAVLIARNLFDFRKTFKLVDADSLSDFFKTRFFRDALPAGFLFIVSTVYNRIDILILEHFKGAEAVASYGLAYKVYDQVILGSAFLMASLFPILARSFVEDRQKLREYYQRSFDTLLISGIVGGVLLISLSPIIISFLGGGQYRESVDVLRLLSLAILPSFINHLTGYSLLAFGKQRLSLAIAITALVVNTSLNFFLIPYYSYYGAALITIATEFFVLGISTFVVSKSTGILPSLTSFPSTLLQAKQIYSLLVKK